MNILHSRQGLKPIHESIGVRVSPAIALPSTFEVPRREVCGGAVRKNMCGRDFLWLCLHRRNPRRWNTRDLSPAEVTRRQVFGPDVWPVSGLHLANVFDVLRDEGLRLCVDGRPVGSWGGLALASLRRSPWRFWCQALGDIRYRLERGQSCGVVLAIRLGGAVNHVMFVVGVADEGLVVLDTHRCPRLEYRQITMPDDPRLAMLIPYAELERRWKRFSHILTVEEI